MKPIFDYTSGEFIYGGSSGSGFDSDGDMMMRISDNMAMDMDTGELHIVSLWNDDDDE